jgi:hypothetical protein
VFRKVLLVPFCYFVLFYILLSLPWPGWNEAYCAFFRGISGWFYAGDSGQRNVSFEPLQTPEHPFYTRVVIVNRSLMSAGGGGPIWNLDLDTIGMGWEPTALLIALTMATPISRKRRCWALFFGLLAEQTFILLSLGYFIWIESAGVSLVILSPFWKEIAESFANLLREQIALAAPILIWALVTFRRADVGLFVLNIQSKKRKSPPLPQPQIDNPPRP